MSDLIEEYQKETEVLRRNQIEILEFIEPLGCVDGCLSSNVGSY